MAGAPETADAPELVVCYSHSLEETPLWGVLLLDDIMLVVFWCKLLLIALRRFKLLVLPDTPTLSLGNRLEPPFYSIAAPTGFLP